MLDDLEIKVNIYLFLIQIYKELKTKKKIILAGNAFTILDDDKELKSFKRIINNIENVKIKVLPIAIEKLIDEYTDNELEDLNLTIESNDEIKNENENENEKKDCQGK